MDQQYSPITTEEIFQAARNDQWIQNAEIQDFHEVLRQAIQNDDTNALKFKNCRILSCQCHDITIPIAISFISTLFVQPVGFENTTFVAAVEFSGSEFMKEAIFYQAKFYSSTSFASATFHQSVGFSDAEFQGLARFWETSARQSANFNGAKFGGDALFSKSRFEDVSQFARVSFGGSAYFDNVKFGAPANFINARFADLVSFNGATFRQRADFRESQFMGDTTFTETKFSLDADFSMARFHAHTWFRKTKFYARAVFMGCFVSGVLDIQTAQPRQNSRVNFRGTAVVSGGHVLIGRKHIGSPWPTGWMSEQGKVVHFIISILIRIHRSFHPQYASDPWIEDEHSSEKEACRSAALQYNMLRDSFRLQAGAGDKEDRCHYKFKNLTRRGSERRHLWRAWDWWDWGIMKWCLGYGIYTKRILLTSIGIIFLFAFLYWMAAGHDTIRFIDGPQSVEQFMQSDFNSIYFSVITFTTIGYGDFAPLGWLRIAAGIEGFLGLVLMALFTVSFARKLVR